MYFSKNFVSNNEGPRVTERLRYPPSLFQWRKIFKVTSSGIGRVSCNIFLVSSHSHLAPRHRSILQVHNLPQHRNIRRAFNQRSGFESYSPKKKHCLKWLKIACNAFLNTTCFLFIFFWRLGKCPDPDFPQFSQTFILRPGFQSPQSLIDPFTVITRHIGFILLGLGFNKEWFAADN